MDAETTVYTLLPNTWTLKQLFRPYFLIHGRLNNCLDLTS